MQVAHLRVKKGALLLGYREKGKRHLKTGSIVWAARSLRHKIQDHVVLKGTAFKANRLQR
jgi:hypothetical protein